MDLGKPLRMSMYLSQVFGLASFEISKSNGKFVFLPSAMRLKLAKMNFAVCVALHGLLFYFSTEEIKAAKDDLSVKVVRFVNLLAFAGGIAVMFSTVLTKGDVICEGLNRMNELCTGAAGKTSVKVLLKRNGPLFLGTIVNFTVTVLPLLVYALYLQRRKMSKVISYSYYIFSMWLENVFIYHFVTLARFLGDAYSLITRIPDGPKMSNGFLHRELRRIRSHEEILKDFIDVLLDVYKYALFFWICWSFTMVLQFVLKVNLKTRVVVWCFFISYRAIIIIYSCSIVRNEVQKNAENLHRLFIRNDDPQVRDEIEIYSYQLLHRQPEFSALGFFNLDFPLFHSMVSSVATYIVVLMQLKGSV